MNGNVLVTDIVRRPLVSGKERRIWYIFSLIPKVANTISKENVYQRTYHRSKNVNLEISYFREVKQGISGHGNTAVALVSADCVPLAGCLEGRLRGIF